MRRFKQVVLTGVLIAIAAVGICSYRAFMPGPASVIRNRITSLAGALSVEPDQSKVARLARTASLDGYFAPEITVHYLWRRRMIDRAFKREELLARIRSTQLSMDRLRVKVHDIKVELPEAPNESHLAYAYFTAVVDINDEDAMMVQEIKATWEKHEGQWGLREIKTMETFRI